MRVLPIAALPVPLWRARQGSAYRTLKVQLTMCRHVAPGRFHQRHRMPGAAPRWLGAAGLGQLALWGETGRSYRP